MAPTVPTYDAANASLASIYDPQTASVQSQIDQLAPQQAAQQASLDQAKVNAFKDIDSSANTKGLLFSGFSPAEEGVYTGTKYLPAVANLQTSINNSKTTLLDKINSINAARATQAQGIVSDAQKEADTVAYNNAKLQATAATAASKASIASTALPSAAQVRSGISQGLSSVTGKDGYVSPQDYAKALGDWLAAGLPRAQFNQEYKNFRNPTNTYYDYAIKQAGL